MLSSSRIEVVGSRICHVAAGVIGYDGDVITYFVLVRIAFEWSKRIAHCHVGRPGDAAIGAVGVEQLRVGVIGCVTCIKPHTVDASIRSDRKRAEPVPLVRIDWIVVNPLWPAKALAAVGAAGEHHVCSATAERLHAGQHVNIVGRRATRPVDRQETLPSESTRINPAAKNQAAAQVHLSALIKRWCDARVLRVAGANAPERAAKVGRAADKEVAVGGHVECSPYRRIRDTEWTLPGEPAVC